METDLRSYGNQPDLVPRPLGTMTKLEIVLEHDIDEQYHYKPGENLSGKVQLHIENGHVELLNLKLNILGLCSVGWQTTDKGSCSSQEEYINDTLQLAPLDSQTLNLQKGKHDFNFSYQLPNRLPSSFIGKYGSVTYVIKASAQDKRNHIISSEPFLVANRQFPWSNQEMMQPLQANVERRYKGGLFRNGKIKVTLKLPRRGYFPGDDIDLNVEVINKSPRTVLGIQVALMMNTSFTAQTNVHTHIQNLARREQKWELIKGEGRRWNNSSITIPLFTPESNLEGCDIIDIRFEITLKIEVKKKRKDEEDLMLTLPVLIGPLSQVTDPHYRPSNHKEPRTIDRKTLEHMDIAKLLDLQQEDGTKFEYDQPVSDGTLRVNPLYNKDLTNTDEDELGRAGSDESINQSTRL